MAKELRGRLGLEMRRWFAAHEAAVIQLEKLLHSDLTLGALCDVFGFALPIAIEVKQQLLEDVDVVRAGAGSSPIWRRRRRRNRSSAAGARVPAGFSSN